MKKLLSVLLFCTFAVLLSFTFVIFYKNRPTITTIVIQSDTTFVIPENPTGFENWLRIEFPDSLANDIYINVV